MNLSFHASQRQLSVNGEDHESDFLKMIFTCAPMLKRVTLRLADGITPCVDWCTKVDNIFKAYPSVKCKVDLGQHVAAKVLH
uniref:FBD domain-containing protein n=1 Tax=Aegilops tauschii subsp. strangulata TaxID=200361 RepID=A0A453HFV3_AEGTS